MWGCANDFPGKFGSLLIFEKSTKFLRLFCKTATKKFPAKAGNAFFSHYLRSIAFFTAATMLAARRPYSSIRNAWGPT